MNLTHACNFHQMIRRMLGSAQRTISGALRYSSPNTTQGFSYFTQYSTSLVASSISTGGFGRPHQPTRVQVTPSTRFRAAPETAVCPRLKSVLERKPVCYCYNVFRDNGVSCGLQITSYVLFLLCST